MPVTNKKHRRRLRRDRRLGGVTFPSVQDFYLGTVQAPFQPSVGSRVEHVIRRCLYRLTDEPAIPERARGLWFMFNNYRVTVLRGDTEATAMARFDAARERERQWRLNSRAHRKHQEYQRRYKARKQAAFDAALATRPTDLTDLDATVEWIGRWQPHIVIGTNWKPNELLMELGAAGYSQNMNCIDKSDPQYAEKQAALTASRKLMGEYLIGQAMSCMASGMPPHDVYQHMIKQWRATPA